MRRILLLIIAVAVAAYAGWYYWNFSQQISSAPVAGLLPRDTIFLAHMPDFNRTQNEWYQSDIYQLYQPAYAATVTAMINNRIRLIITTVSKRPMLDTRCLILDQTQTAWGSRARIRYRSSYALG